MMQPIFLTIYIAIFWCYLTFKCVQGKKNIVLILADDLDSELDGMIPLKNTNNFIGSQGTTFTNCFVASPICCPNRASILTGRYQHNHRTVNNSIVGGCNNRQWRRKWEDKTFAAVLKNQLGYTTFYAGKYSNQYGKRAAGGIAHIPSGWDWWAGLVGNSRYYNYSLSINGTEKRYGESDNEYFTDVISHMALEFLKGPRNYDSPFLMVLAPPAPHEPFTPATRHIDFYKNITAKRTPNFNTPIQQDKHWLLRKESSPLSQNTLSQLDFIYRRRWESLLAVDDLVFQVYETLRLMDILNNTYIIFTSDNGYHVGQFNLPKDKRQLYETDIRVPLLIRGPGIASSTIVEAPTSSVDLFDTILQMAEINRKVQSDGASVLSKTISSDRTVLIEYRGEHTREKVKFGCPTDYDKNVSHCDKNLDCKCEDSKNNTYSCIRTLGIGANNIFCVFEDSENFIEAYDLHADQYQLSNIGQQMSNKEKKKFKKFLKQMKNCYGVECITTINP